MNRITVIQEIIDQQKAETYLEIGFGHGDCFLNIRAPQKSVVDSKFVILKKRTLKYFFKNISKNIFNRYYRMTSDDFFAKRNAPLNKGGLDVVFIDGLHTYRQSLKDVLNSLKFLKEDGVIIIHDCNPESETAAHPAPSYENAASLSLPGWAGFWSGDVWKTIAYLRSSRRDLNIFVLDFDRGLGIITRGEEKDILEYSPEEIEKFSYKDLEKNREKILNLKDAKYFKEFIKSL